MLALGLWLAEMLFDIELDADYSKYWFAIVSTSAETASIYAAYPASEAVSVICKYALNSIRVISAIIPPRLIGLVVLLFYL